MDKISSNIKNIIFDLGGVLLNINYQLTIEAFKKLGIQNFDDVFSQFKQSNISDLFETGKISGEEFYMEVSKGHQLSRKDFDEAWNAMLLDFPKERFDLLKSLKSKYNLYLCSNTNETHYKAFINIVNQFSEPFEGLFNEVYYSHKVGLRKPDTAIFEYIINENNLLPNETLFLDDSPQHLEGAEKVGLHTIWVNQKSIQEIFED